MATYFHGSSEIQADTLQTLYLMNPNYVAYSDTQHNHQQQQPPANMFFLNSAAGNPLNTPSISQAPPHQNHHFVGIPLPTVGSNNSEDHNRPSVHEIPALHGMVPRFHYNLWGNVDQTTAGATVASNSGDVLSQLGFRRPAVAVPMSPTTTHQPQGLSLSLNSSQNLAYRSLAGEHDISGQPPLASGGEDVRRSGGSPSSVSNGISSLQSVILGSKYLKAAQQVLDEVVNVGKEINSDTGEGTKEKAKMKRESMAVTGGGDGESSGKNVAELTAAQRQELQMKKAKLVNMLDEVEQRYRQYHHQMQIVVSSFEQAAGIGSAKSYTALALQTISKQFRCLKDVITGQIKTTSKSLGEDDGSGGKAEGSRLKFVDQQLRQQRALQQLGMIQVQHNAWRPQRGLPERAVSVLRAWLFEHFLHPYPKDSDKHMLAKQTGLTRGQVSNWFINARVRLWKPMVEEMYMEEMKDQEQNVSENNMTKTEPHKDSSSKSTALEENTSFFQNDQTKQERPINQNTSPTEISNLTASTPPFGGSIQPQTGFTTLMRSSDMEGIVHRSPKKPKSSDKLNSPSSILSMEMDMKPRGETDKGIKDSYLFGTYPIGEIERFDHEQLATTRYHSHGSGFSLTLGLPHCETHQQNYLSNNQNIQLGRRLNMGAVESHYSSMIDPQQPQPSHSNTRYESMNIHDRKRFAAQLLPDFVA